MLHSRASLLLLLGSLASSAAVAKAKASRRDEDILHHDARDNAATLSSASSTTSQPETSTSPVQDAETPPAAEAVDGEAGTRASTSDVEIHVEQMHESNIEENEWLLNSGSDYEVDNEISAHQEVKREHAATSWERVTAKNQSEEEQSSVEMLQTTTTSTSEVVPSRSTEPNHEDGEAPDAAPAPVAEKKNFQIDPSQTEYHVCRLFCERPVQYASVERFCDEVVNGEIVNMMPMNEHVHLLKTLQELGLDLQELGPQLRRKTLGLFYVRRRYHDRETGKVTEGDTFELVEFHERPKGYKRERQNETALKQFLRPYVEQIREFLADLGVFRGMEQTRSAINAASAFAKAKAANFLAASHLDVYAKSAYHELARVFPVDHILDLAKTFRRAGVTDEATSRNYAEIKVNEEEFGASGELAAEVQSSSSAAEPSSAKSDEQESSISTSTLTSAGQLHQNAEEKDSELSTTLEPSSSMSETETFQSVLYVFNDYSDDERAETAQEAQHQKSHAASEEDKEHEHQRKDKTQPRQELPSICAEQCVDYPFYPKHNHITFEDSAASFEEYTASHSLSSDREANLEKRLLANEFCKGSFLRTWEEQMSDPTTYMMMWLPFFFA
ncbi:unnamed protein product [Amoebophrya sp. A120]|nr:unnamed protein product [Amoebophrya sp. A120]|eukprot:GSA120T00005790001.1